MRRGHLEVDPEAAAGVPTPRPAALPRVEGLPGSDLQGSATGADASGRAEALAEEPGVASPEPSPVLEADDQQLSGRLVLLDGTPLEGFRIQASPQGGKAERAFGTTGPEGSFQFKGLIGAPLYRVTPAGMYRVRTVENEPVAVPASEVLVRVNALLVRLQWPVSEERPATGEPLTVRVQPFGADGVPYGAATEMIEAPSVGGITRFLPTGCGYVIAVARKGEGELCFLVPVGCPSGQVEGTLLADAPGLGAVDVLLRNGSVPLGTRISLRLVPVPESFSYPVPTAGAVATMRDHSKGQTLNGLLPGDYEASVSVGGTPPYGFVLPSVRRSLLTVDAGARQALRVDLERGGLFRIEVVLPEGSGPTPVKFQIEVRDEVSPGTWSPMYVKAASGGPPLTSVKSGEAVVPLEPLAPGTRTLRVTSEGWRPEELTVEIQRSVTSEWTVRVQPEG